MVNFSWRWNGNGCFCPTMEWRWSLRNFHHHHQWFLVGSTIGSDTTYWNSREIAQKYRHQNQKAINLFLNFFAFLCTYTSLIAIDMMTLKPENKYGMKIHWWTLIKANLAQDTQYKRHLKFSSSYHWFVWYLLQLDIKAENLLPSPKINGC